MVDTRNTVNSMVFAWLVLGRRLAVAAGAAVALIALCNDVNLWVASLRGGITCLAVLFVSKYAARALRWSAEEAPAVQRAPSDTKPKS